MFRAQDITIKHKLMSIIMATSFFALLVVGISFSVWSQFSAKRDLVRSLSTQAKIIAKNCQAAITFEDAEGAKETLQSLSVVPSLLYGAIYTTKDVSFASYTRNDEIEVPSMFEDHIEILWNDILVGSMTRAPFSTAYSMAVSAKIKDSSCNNASL